MQQTIECIKALSKIEGAVMSLGGITNRAVFNDNIDIVMKYLNEKLEQERILAKRIEECQNGNFLDIDKLIEDRLCNN